MLETTEQRNTSSTKLDSMNARQIAELMNQQDQLVASAVEAELDSISEAIEAIHASLRAGGRLVYIGAGTSGRLGVLDASECPPTFNSPPEMVVGLIAGGDRALRTPIEGAEDDPDQAARDLTAIDFGGKDILMGIATSGRTPYVIGGLQFARNLGAKTIGFVCNANSKMHGEADIMIAPIVGPEILSGSTRLKSGTATKMVLNMLTTGAMVLLGKTYGNLMVDLRATNSKLKERSVRIVSELTELDARESLKLLQQCDGEVKTAIVMQLNQVSASEARKRLTENDGHLRSALDSE